MTIPLDRRGFLTTCGGLTLGAASSWATTSSAARSGPPAATSCVLVHLLGGPSHLDMFDLKPEAPSEIRGPFHPIATTVPGLEICEHLPRLATLAHHYAIIRSVAHNNNNHTPMIYYSLTGNPVERPEMDNDVRPPQRDDSPHIGAIVARLKPSPSGLPGYVAIPEVATRSSIEGEFVRGRVPLRGGGSGFLGPAFDPLVVEPDFSSPPPIGLPPDVSSDRLARRAALRRLLDQPVQRAPRLRELSDLQDQAVSITGSSLAQGNPFAVDTLPLDAERRYGTHRFGRAMFLARRLVEAEVPMVAIHWNEMTVCDGWDTHSKNFEALETELLPMLDQGLSALITDLVERGLLDRTLILVFGEFGRTPRINKDQGRDHWGNCQSVLFAGGGIRGGSVLGSSDRHAAYPTTDRIDPTDLHATLFHCLGLDPHAELRDPLGRPFPLSRGHVITPLL